MPRLGGQRISYANVLFVGRHGVGKGTVIQSLMREQSITVNTCMPRELRDQLEKEKHTLMVYFMKWDGLLREGLQFCPSVVALAMCFAVDDAMSMYDVKRYGAVARASVPSIPVFLLGLRVDQRTSIHGPVSHEQGEELAREINAVMYYDCSAATHEMIPELKRAILKFVTEHYTFQQPY